MIDRLNNNKNPLLQPLITVKINLLHTHPHTSNMIYTHCKYAWSTQRNNCSAISLPKPAAFCSSFSSLSVCTVSHEWDLWRTSTSSSTSLKKIGTKGYCSFQTFNFWAQMLDLGRPPHSQCHNYLPERASLWVQTHWIQQGRLSMHQTALRALEGEIMWVGCRSAIFQQGGLVKNFVTVELSSTAE